jgi:hypothetical protein
MNLFDFSHAREQTPLIIPAASDRHAGGGGMAAPHPPPPLTDRTVLWTAEAERQACVGLRPRHHVKARGVKGRGGWT